MPTVSEIMAVLDAIAPPHLCMDDDPRGLLIGDPNAEVKRLAVALDVTPVVIESAIASGAQMIIAHHPLIYRPLAKIRANEPHPGGVVLSCIKAGVAVACAHTNWDIAEGGVNDVLASLLQLQNIQPIQTTYREPLVKIAVFMPTEYRDRVFDAMANAGAGAYWQGNYDRCSYWTTGTGTFRPLAGATPFIGNIGTPELVAEDRLEMIAPESKWRGIVAAMTAAHPYEEVAYDVYPLANTGAEFGLGRIGTLPEAITARELLATVKKVLRFDAVRMVGPGHRIVRKIAVGGGACAFLVPDAMRKGADALVTSDVRHHEYVDAESRGFLLLDAGHAQTETPGTQELAHRLRVALPTLPVDFFDASGTPW